MTTETWTAWIRPLDAGLWCFDNGVDYGADDEEARHDRAR
jgi:hypothetical protein